MVGEEHQFYKPETKTISEYYCKEYEEKAVEYLNKQKSQSNI